MSRVDDLPIIARPFVIAFGWLFGTLWFLANRLVHATCRLHVEGQDRVEQLDRAVWCGWHNTIGPLLAAFPRLPGHVWLNHPAWSMKPVHVLCGWMGIRVILGSTGHSGRRAAERLVEALRAGARTVVWPDGPAGPPLTLKTGVLHIAQQAGVPIVPLRISARPCLRFPRSWDGKRFPLPFCTITVVFGEALDVPPGEEGIGNVRDRLVAALGDGTTG